MLDAEQSQDYLKKHRIDKHSDMMPKRFLSPRLVRTFIPIQPPSDPKLLDQFSRDLDAAIEKVGSDLITMDHNGDIRVFVKR